MSAKTSGTEMMLDEAVGYLSPHPSSHGPIILTASVMRKAIEVIRENLNRVGTLEIQSARLTQERDELQGELDSCRLDLSAADEDAWKYRELASS
jgi:hypothetical protein